MQQSLTCQFLEENKKNTLKFGEPLDYSILLCFRVHLEHLVCLLLALDRGPGGHKRMSYIWAPSYTVICFVLSSAKFGISIVVGVNGTLECAI
jgi:hypothetical protein